MANPKRIVDPTKFLLLGALIDWTTVYRRYVERAPSPKQIVAERRLDRFKEEVGTPRPDRIVQLRWLLAPDQGYPTEPFTVWRRPAMPAQGEAKVTVTQVNFFGLRVFSFDRPRVFVRVSLQCAGTETLIAFAGAPFASSIVATRSLAAGFRTEGLSGPAIQCLVLSAGATLVSITGIGPEAADDPQWQPVEIVGLPVDPRSGGGFARMTKQGFVNALGDPRAAALDRFQRGAPFYGWENQITAGVAAPAWQLANPKAMLKVMDVSMLEPLHKMVENFPPNAQGEFVVDHMLPLAGGGGDPAHASFKPLQTLLFGAATDPLSSLISGYGTAFVDIDLPPITLGERKLFGDPSRSDWDYMVTARFERGADGRSDPVDYAAFVFAPGLGNPPPVPTNLLATSDGLRSPQGTDADWLSVTRVAWDKLNDTLPFRVGSYAFARAQQAPAGPVTPLMDPRPYDTALQPISATTSPAQEATGRLLALDERYALASVPNPNALLYGLAHQDLFGLWSAWTSAPFQVGEPPVRPVSILSSRLDVTPVAAGRCPAVLVLEYAWDWAARGPQRFEFVGRLYAQARLGAAPTDLSVPVRLQMALGDLGPDVLKVVHNGAATGLANPAFTVNLQYLSQDGQQFEAVPPTTAGPRRYRLTVSGFSLDFNTAPRIGLALWARAVENRWPNREGPWSGEPSVASTADPRPPILLIEHEDVLLASMADAAGEHHARIEWPAAAGAAGYFVYTTTEEKLRADRGLASASKSLTLSQRLVALRDAFEADPSRRSFTRVNAQPVTTTSLQVSLPRGSKEIHLYVVLGQSAGLVESAWPQLGEAGLRKRPIAYAAPQVVLPSPPDLEVARVLDDSVVPPAWRAQLRVRSKPGAAVSRIDLHRVRVPEAALLLDTMGPPIARLTGSAGPYTVTPTVLTDGGVVQVVGTVNGRDAVEGSWKRVFYRAVAWSADDPPRGLYGGRSSASALREVIVPPATPPDLSALGWHWPGSGLPDVQVDATSLAPVDETPLGPHHLQITVIAEHADGRSDTLFSHPDIPGSADRLDRVGTTPPLPGAHGLWCTPGAPGSTGLHLLLRRASVDDRLRVRWLLSDPLGRATEQVLDVPPGSPIKGPDIVLPKVTKVPGKGFLLSFLTTVPIAPTPIGPYTLTVQYTPAAMTSKTLDKLALAVPGENVFADLAAIPLRRSRTTLKGTPIAIALRGAGGNVTVVLASPDGRTAKLTRRLA